MQTCDSQEQPSTIVVDDTGQMPELNSTDVGETAAMKLLDEDKRNHQVVRGKKRRRLPKSEKAPKDVRSLYVRGTRYSEDPMPDSDGMYRCVHCKRSFGKERHIRGHLCFAANVDDKCHTHTAKSRRGGSQWISPAVLAEELLNGSNDVGKIDVHRKLPWTADVCLDSSETPKHIPVFSSQEQRKAFEERMNSIDLSCSDHLFTKHTIVQQIQDSFVLPNKAVPRANDERFLFSCNVCKKVFKCLSRARVHCLVHTDMKPFRCLECHFASNTKGNLYTHMRKHTVNRYTCSQCSYVSSNRCQLLKHVATHGSQQPEQQQHSCSVCGRVYGTLKTLVNHMQKYHGCNRGGRENLRNFATGALLYQCHVCCREFKQKVDRDRHLFIHDVHLCKNVYVCGLCSYATRREVCFDRHFRRHRLVYFCCQCNGRFLSATALRQHLEADHPMGNADYDLGLMLLFQESLNFSWFLPEMRSSGELLANIPKELVENHSEALDSDNDADNGVFTSEDDTQTEGNTAKGSSVLDMIRKLKYKRMSAETYDVMRETFGKVECVHCGRFFQSKGYLNTHIKIHREDKQFKCQRCSYCTASKSCLKRHEQTIHERPNFTCDACGFVAHSHSSLWCHSQKHKAITMKCTECNNEFPTQKELQQHMVSAHPRRANSQAALKFANCTKRVPRGLGQRSYKCPYCSRVFHHSRTALKRHMWIHEGTKPFKCPLCPHTCRSQNNLNVHLLRHSNERPHRCGKCGKAYKSIAALGWHEKTHVDGLQFRCPHCEYVGSQKSHLKRHLEVHHVLKKFARDLGNCSSDTAPRTDVHRAQVHNAVVASNCQPAVPREAVTLSATPNDSTGEISVYKCFGCNYLFGNLTDMKRHLKVKHHLPDHNIDELKLAELPLPPEVDRGNVVHVADVHTAENSDDVLNMTRQMHAEDKNRSPVDDTELPAANVNEQVTDDGMSDNHELGGPVEVTLSQECVIEHDEVELAVPKVMDSEIFRENDGRSSPYVIQCVTHSLEGW